MKLDLITTLKENPDAAGKPRLSALPPIQKVGYKLAIVVLAIIAAYILFIIL